MDSHHHQDSTRSGSSPSLSKKPGKILAVRVQMLDDTITMFQIQAKALGSVLFEQVCQQVHLLESDYFGLEYTGPEKVKYWLDLDKPMNRQMGLSLSDPMLRFGVKFYPPDPAQLEEEFTRYLFCMQIKQDLAHGVLQCNDKTAALIASYLVQAECGDYVAEDYPDHTYLSTFKFVPHQDAELERRIMDNHKKHGGQSPAEADLNMLETARRCELYGIKMHPAKDPEGVPLNLAVAHMGVLVFQNYAKINTFSWAKVRKLSFKRKKFLIKLHPEAHGSYKDVIEFHFESRDECKNFWKKCVEHHGFFRGTATRREVRQKPGVLSRGSSFRYTGRTQKEVIEYVRENYVKRQSFQRSQSFRHSSPLHAAGVGTSLSVHPLLPVGDNVIVASDSVSCGSAALVSEGARGRSHSTPERTETVDVHQAHADADRELDVESPITSNTSSSPQHAPFHHHHPQQLYQNQPVGAFHSLPRSGAHPAAAAAAAAAAQGQTQTPLSTLSNPASESVASASRVAVLRSLSCSQEDSLCSSEYTDPATYPEPRDEALPYVEEAVSRDSYELLSDSEPIFVSPDEVPYLLHRRPMTASKSCDTVIRDDSVSLCGVGQESGAGDDDMRAFQRSRSFRSLREKTYREKPSALFARARLVEIDLNVIDPEPALPSPARSLVRPKSIEFVAFHSLPPPDAFSSRDDTVEQGSDDDDTARDEPDSQVMLTDPREFVPAHFTANAEYPIVVQVADDDAGAVICLRPALDEDVREQEQALDDEEEEKMCSLISEEEDELPVTATSSVSICREQGIVDDDISLMSRPIETEDDEALTADDVRDVDFVYQDTLSSTSLEEQLVSEDHMFEFVNDDDGLPDPDDVRAEEFYTGMGAVEYVFQTHVLSRISERSDGSRESSDNEEGAGRERNNTMSDVSSSFKASGDQNDEEEEDDGRSTPNALSPLRNTKHRPVPVAEPDPSDIEPTTEADDDCCLPPPPSFDEATPVNEMVAFDPPLDPSVMDDFPSPPSSIDNLPEEDDYSDSSS